jgi:hypothetical protein
MFSRLWVVPPVVVALLATLHLAGPTPACCPAPPSGKPVVNADQTVIILWDKDTKTEHFIRQASFKSQADDFGFLVPSPTQPELSESGNGAFPFLQKLTEPEVQTRRAPRGGLHCACGLAPQASNDKGSMPPQVRVLEEKLVAGFNAAVLEAKSADALVGWLKEHGYAFSPEVQAWAKPYVDAGWKITALKVAKAKDDQTNKDVAAAALRMSFKTDRPLFPYREPDSKSAAEALNARQRLLRIYFLAEARYQGELTKDVPWTGRAAWADKLSPADRAKALEMLKLPATTGPAEWFLTEFEDNWPYRVAPADVYFSADPDQQTIKRPPIIQYVSSPWPPDVTAIALAAVVVMPVLLRKVRRRPKN